MYNNMDNLLRDLKYFLLHHYEQGKSKKVLLGLLNELEDEKKAILQIHFKRIIEETTPILVKQLLMKYINEITIQIDNKRKKLNRII